jgi:DNA-binding NarL/FixJ family response regulator
MIRVLIVDDHPVVRNGLRTFLNAQPDIGVVGEASDGEGVLRQVETLRPDVVLTMTACSGRCGQRGRRGTC